MIIMLDEEFSEMDSDNPDKTLVERIWEIFDKQNSADCGKTQNSEDLSRKNKSTTEQADFWSGKFLFEAVFPALENCKKPEKTYIHRIT